MASKAQVGTAVEGLALFYPVLRRTPDEQRVFVGAWAMDLADYPADLINEAARLWRNSASERFPTPGQFKALVEPMLIHRQALASRCRRILAELDRDPR